MQPSVSMRYGDMVRAGALRQDGAQSAVIDALDRLILALDDWDQSRRSLSRWLGRGVAQAPRGLYIHGGVGRGKTMLMDLFHETVRVRRRRRIHFHRFMADTHDSIAAARHSTEGDPLPEVARQIAGDVSLLCFDEFHVTDIADAMILSRLFKGLFGMGVVIVATSNVAPERLYWNGLNRQLFLPCIAEIEAHMDVIELASPTDHRLAKLQGERLYFTPIGAESDAAMDRLWVRATGGAPAAPLVLDVKGRRVELGRASLGVARVSFEEICERPLGSLDYLALTDVVQVVMIDRVPRLTTHQRNAARRFVTLVDTLYDRRIGLIVSADAAPDALYIAGDGADLFQRTASRLIEMQGADYLAERLTRRMSI
jgi:cell division protein ZapE